MAEESPCIVAGKIYNHKTARRGDLIPFNRMAAAMKLYDDQKLWETWSYLNRTRPHLAEQHIDLDLAIAALREWMKEFAFIESVVGYERTVRWINEAKAQAKMELGQRGRSRQEGEAS